MNSAIDNYVYQRTGNHFDYYSAQINAREISHIPLFLFHDKDDQEAGIDHAEALNKAHGNCQLIVTTGLGHNRILKDKNVIEKIADYSKVIQKPFGKTSTTNELASP